MLKVVAFMKQVAEELRMGGNFGTAHVYRSSTNAIIAYCGEGDFSFDEVTPEWLKGFEIHLRGKGCSWNTVSTYLRTFRAVYNRAVNSRMVVYTPHLFRSVYTGTRDAYSGSARTIKEVYEPRQPFALSLLTAEKRRGNKGGLPGISVGIAQLQPAAHALGGGIGTER